MMSISNVFTNFDVSCIWESVSNLSTSSACSDEDFDLCNHFFAQLLSLL